MGKKRAQISLRKPPSPEALDSFVSAGVPAPEPAIEVAPEVTERVAAPVVEATLIEPTLAVSTDRIASPEPPVIVIPPQPERQEVFVSEDGKALRPITIYLPFPLAEQLGRHCLELDRNVSRVITEAVEAHLSRRLGPAPEWTRERASEAKPSARPGASFVGGFVREWLSHAATNERALRWLDLGRTFFGGLRARAQTA